MQARPSDLDHWRWLVTAKASDFAGKSILDLGCGSGWICDKAMQEGARRAVGIDIVEPENWRAGESRWEYASTDLDHPAWHEDLAGPFDAIYAFDILEHLQSPYAFLCSCRRLLAPQGHLVLTTPNTLSWERRLRPRTWSGASDPQHKTLFHQYSLEFLLQRCGLSVQSLQAPLRKLSFLGPLIPDIGGQMLCVAGPA